MTEAIINSPAPPPKGTTSTKAILTLILGILSVTCCGFFAGIPAIFFGLSEIKAVKAGTSYESNRTLAKVGMIIGIIGTVLSILTFLAYIAFIAMGIASGMLQDFN